MNTEIVSKIVNSLAQREFKQDCMVKFSDQRYSPFPANKSNFRKIHDAGNGKKIAFIDGGNAEVISSPELSVSLVRVYCTVYQDNKRISSQIAEFYSVATSFLKEGEVHYGAEIYDVKGISGLDASMMTFNSYDPTIKQGIFRSKIGIIGGIARRFAEIKMAAAAAAMLEEGDMIVRDGTLQSSVTGESGLLEELYMKASSRGVIVTGLAKTSNLYMDDGSAASSYFLRLGPEGKWFYHPIAEIRHPDHKADLYFARLNDMSNHVFRFEVYKQGRYDIENLVSMLAGNAKDPVFLGYPYGLVEADQFARVTRQDVEYARAMFMAKAGKEWARIKDLMSSSDAHDVLDNIR